MFYTAKQSITSKIFNFQLVCCLLGCFVTLAANVLRLREGRDFYHKTSFGERNFRLLQNCLQSTKPRLLGRCCYAFGFLVFR